VSLFDDERVQFATAGELAALMAGLPADTTVTIAADRVDPELLGNDEANCIVQAARMVSMTRAELVEGQLELHPGVAVELGAFHTVGYRPVPATTVPVNPYDRAMEADHEDTEFAAFGELLEFVADHLDGLGDPAYFEPWPGDTARAELGALLRHAADRLAALRTRTYPHLANQPEG
jgi:hypothetical protein